MKAGKLGIVVSGGPAPGINTVIWSAVLEAYDRGISTVGFLNGFRGAASLEQNSWTFLTPENVAEIDTKGGSILGTSRFNPFDQPETKDAFIRTLKVHDINKLIVIGGEGSAYLSYQVSLQYPNIQIVHVPKTIDNDLILPNEYPSFGFETARSVGTTILKTLRVDAKTTTRWFLVTSMGRKAGFLALGQGIAAGCTMTIIPEEFAGRRTRPADVASIVFESMRKRSLIGKQYGVAVLAEGILDILDPEGDLVLADCPRDALGRIRYSEIELGDVIMPHLRKMCAAEDLNIQITSKNIGYELRCADPMSFDVEYTTFLGYGAVKHLCEGGTGAMVVRDFDKLGYVPLKDLVLPDGSIMSRVVDLNSDYYKVARSFMIR